MDWHQTLTLVGTIIASMLTAIYILHSISKKDTERHDAELAEVRKLWASLMEKSNRIEEKILAQEKENRSLWSSMLERSYALEKEIFSIKLFHSIQEKKKSK